MMNRNVSLAIVAAIAASAGSALADNTPNLTLQPTVVTMDDAAAAVQRRPLMNGLDKLGAASTLDKYNLNIYGWLEASYTYNHRHVNRESSVDGFANKVGPAGTAPFNHEAGDTFMTNQAAIRFVRDIGASVTDGKFDVGGLVEVMYGQDPAAFHANGLEYGNSGGEDRFHPNNQFDIPQAYLTVSPGVKGLSFLAGKFVTLFSYETIQPDNNPLFSHSYLFYSVPFTHVGILGSYQINDQWAVTAGVTRGWDQATEDAPSCAIDGIFQIVYKPTNALTFTLTGSTGPENFADTSHYRTAIDPTVKWQATEQLTLAAEALYIYDGNYHSSSPAGYGDVWGAAVYAAYKINDNFTLNARAEKAHVYTGGFAGSPLLGGLSASAVNIYEITLGVTITPFPKDPWGQGLIIRPEIRYDYSEDNIFDYSTSTSGGFRDQFTLGIDVIYKF